MQTLTGILEWPQRAEGRVRQYQDASIIQRADDPIVPLSFGEQFNLRNGLEVTVNVALKKPRRRRRGKPNGQRQSRPVVDSFVAIEGLPPDDFSRRPRFDELTSIDPQPRLTLEYRACPVSCRLVDLFCPIGRGQRGMIVSPPKAGKTTLLKDIATALLTNHPDLYVFMLLVDERPEEVTDFKRTFLGPIKRDPETGQQVREPLPWSSRVQVIASSNDNDTERHVAVSMMCVERAKRMVEAGRHVVIMLDSLTRVGRAFNRSRQHASSGRTLSGGIDSKALEVPKLLFGAARNTEEAGSLTILATCLVDTGSQGDQVIFEEFKGTGNMELILDRKISEKRLFPAINLAASGTRKDELLLDPQTHATVTALRRRLMNMPPPQQVEQLLVAMQRFDTNSQLVGSAGPSAQSA
ncbi:MAG TPA: transcription termination factor Rho [Phycisphaerales bacterium]|nr:transcription termination factor Rho [Phycisphaerales bacterium]